MGEGLSASAITHLDADQLRSLSSQQLAHLSPHVASLLTKEKFLLMEPQARMALRGVGGESRRVRRDLEEVGGDLDSEVPSTTESATSAVPEPKPETSAEPEPESEPGTTPEPEVEPEPEHGDATSSTPTIVLLMTLILFLTHYV